MLKRSRNNARNQQQQRLQQLVPKAPEQSVNQTTGTTNVSQSRVNETTQPHRSSTVIVSSKLPTSQCPFKKLTSLSSFITRPASVARQKRLNRLLLEMIVKELQPFSIVEYAGFRRFVTTGLDPSYVIPIRKTIATDLLQVSYSQTVEGLKAVLAEAEAVCLTTDSWTSTCTENYIAVTGHFKPAISSSNHAFWNFFNTLRATRPKIFEMSCCVSAMNGK